MDEQPRESRAIPDGWAYRADALIPRREPERALMKMPLATMVLSI